MAPTLKISILGPGGVGKTCTVIRLTRGKFDAEYVPTIQDYFEKQLVVDGEMYNLTIIDTAGQEELAQITDMAITEAQAFILVYSVKSVVSFQETEKYYNKVKQICGESSKIILIGNMCDVDELDRGVTPEQGKELAAKWGIPFYETSALKDINITETFEHIVRLLVPKQETKEESGCCNIA